MVLKSKSKKIHKTNHKDNKNQGTILRVAGPVVQAKLNAAINDLVRVGNSKLLGEVIQMEQEIATIQVYEDTTGLSPGEPVINTKQALSVALGPGILGGVFDGTQRPLNVIAKSSGIFIPRGVDVPALDQTKKWKFTPTIKNGTAVKEGQIIGTVKENPVITHKIMVPVGVSGKITSIKSGEFTITDTIATVTSNDNKIAKLTMLQHWPVRIPRPYHERIGVEGPLVSGQRVIDFVAPIAKGGVAAIPGPFGSGKCVIGETPLLMGDGTLKPIKEIYKSFQNKGKKTINNNEEYVSLKTGISIFSYERGKIILKKTNLLYKGKTDSTYKITMRSGRYCEITPVHKLFKFKDINVIETEAQNLKVGDFLLAPRKIEFEGQDQLIDLSCLSKERVCDKKILDEIPFIINQVSKKYGSKKVIAKKLNVSYDTLINYQKRNKPTLEFTKKLYQFAKKPLSFSLLKGERQSHQVRIPRKINEDFSEFLGLVLGDGSLKPKTVAFYNNDEKLLTRFDKLSEKLFNLKAERGITNTVKCSLVHSTLLVRLLHSLGVPKKQKSRNCFVPKKIMMSKNSTLARFISAYFLCDGHISKIRGKSLEISTASKMMQLSQSYLLLRLGILHKLEEKVVNGTKQFRIFISSKAEISKFFNLCYQKGFTKYEIMKDYVNSKKGGFTSIDIVPISKGKLKSLYEGANKPYKLLKEKGIEIHNYIGNGANMSKPKFQEFASLIGNPSFSTFAQNHLNHIFCDKIVKIEIINEKKEVYDITVPRTHNFVGGFGPMVLHNTVTQQQFAKWSDADIIIYVGCGERGNEMTEVLEEFPNLKDPKSGKALMNRTILVANTSNMPVAARESCVYTGITIAEYFRDQGYAVALMADSTSRWAEAMREISGRLEEMPGEEGYPAYLAKRLAEFYERAGRVTTLSGGEGSVSVVGAVSPPGGDFSEPVTQNTLRISKCFWALDAKLADKRHFPAINWLKSYSLYTPITDNWYNHNVGKEWGELRHKTANLLQQENELQEIVQLVGMDSLPAAQQLLLFIARIIREDFLQQNAFHKEDTFCPLEKQLFMIKSIFQLYESALEVADGLDLEKLRKSSVAEYIAGLKYESNDLFSGKNIKVVEAKVKKEIVAALKDQKIKKNGIKDSGAKK